MVDRYYRKIESVENDIENAMQISGILLKLKGYDKKLDDLSKIDDNATSISTNSGKIDSNINAIKLVNKNSQDNRADISTNSGQINTNTGDISTNLGKINTNTSSISTNSGQISTNTSAISTNSGQISTNTSAISTNLGKINTNENNIDEINSNLSNIDFNSGNKFSIENFFIYNIEIEKNYILNKDKTSFSIFKYTLEDDFKKDSMLEIDCRLLYQYRNYNHIGLLQHVFKLYDDNDNMFYDYNSLETNSGDNTRNDIKQNDVFYVKLNDNYKIIKIELNLSLISNVSNTATVDCKIYNSYKSNFLSIKYYKKINLISVNNNLGDLENTILSNKNDTSTNLININTNEDNIAYNLNEINYLKNNKPTQYLKNVYNILFYDSKKQISFKDEIFYEKVFDIDASINDFVEIKFKIGLEYRRINDRNYVKNIYEILDENDNSLYIKSASNNEYSYFSNRLIIDEEIFYNFTKNIKKIKFVIKFQKISSTSIIYLYYIKNDNYRLVIKNYGL